MKTSLAASFPADGKWLKHMKKSQTYQWTWSLPSFNRCTIHKGEKGNGNGNVVEGGLKITSYNHKKATSLGEFFEQ